MDKQEIIRVLNELDKHMQDNLNSNNKFSNPADGYLKIYWDKIEQIKSKINSKYIPIEIVKRFEMTRQAFEDARNKHKVVEDLDMSSAYYQYIDNTRSIEKTGIRNEEDAMDCIRKAIIAHHFPNLKALDYISYNGTSLENGIEYANRLLPRTNRIYEAMYEDRGKALMVQQKENIFSKIINKIKDLFKTKEASKEYVNNTIAEDSEKSFREGIKETPNLNLNAQNIKKEKTQYVAVSDLHGHMDRWNSVKKLLQDNPNTHVYMLGDTMDRGEFGPEILLQIKELSDEGKITYLPGNHDIFAYEYLDEEHPGIKRWAQLHLEVNGGKGTMNKLDNFEKVVAYELASGNIKKQISREELRNWLGKQPVQIVKQAGKYTYAMAHALFDLELYNYNKKFNLSNALKMELEGKKDSEMYRRFKTAMWYRQENEKNTKEADLAFPDGWIAIGGHTPQREIKLKYIDGSPYKPMICIDTGSGEFKGFNLTTGEEIGLEEQNLER